MLPRAECGVRTTRDVFEALDDCLVDLEGAIMSRVSYRTVEVEGLSVFYREAGPHDAPSVLLLHGFPSSSRMYEPLLRRMAASHHLVAPDFIGFGHSDAPDPKSFAYTFDHLAEVVDGFTVALGLQRYSMYLQDYGGPVGFRLALTHPERVEAIVIQNTVAHEEGLGPLWDKRRAFWADRKAHEAALRISYRLRQPDSGTWEATPTRPRTTPISGRTSSPS